MSFLEQVEAHLRDRVAPQANILDHSVVDLQQALRELGQQGWLGLKIPGEWGGLECSTTEFQAFQELLAQYSGALAFLQAQHQSAGGLLSRSVNLDLQRAYLPGMATGAIAVGIAFSHLRRPVPSLKALPVAGGYLLHGTLPWITGYGLFQAFVGAAVLPDGQALYAMLPFTQTVQADGGEICFSEPLPLAAMTSTNTVTAELQQWVLPESQVVFIRPADAIQNSDRQNVLQHSFYALGCARAALNLIEQMAETRSQTILHQAYRVLNQELRQCRAAIYGADERSVAERVALRAWAIELAGRCAHVAVTLSAGAANLRHHPSQRIYREALVFTVTGQTAAILEATVERLIGCSPATFLPGDNALEIDGEKS
jgi:alkylation response protein AidB-like acyl-CoA dehydrogenase